MSNLVTIRRPVGYVTETNMRGMREGRHGVMTVSAVQNNVFRYPIFSEEAVKATEWQPIETAPSGVTMILYFPTDRRLAAMIKVDRYPVYYPRQPTDWMPLPEPPK